MNPIFTAVMQAFMRVQRKCPKCGKVQFVSARKKAEGEKVKCIACGAQIPPPGSGSSAGES